MIALHVSMLNGEFFLWGEHAREGAENEAVKSDTLPK